jgi:hypothetical protein
MDVHVSTTTTTTEPPATKPRLAVPLAIFAVAAAGLAIALASADRGPAKPDPAKPAGRAAADATTAASKPAATTSTAAAPTTTKPAAATNAAVTSLFDGKTLGHWKSTEFGGEGEVSVDGGRIVVRAGSTLSGVNWTGPVLPTSNYELELDAMKLDGSDFFLALTFPYKQTFASVVLGGWGGSVVGISSISGDDAANNQYSTVREFPKDKWFHVRLRVTDDRIQAWLADEAEPFLDVETEGKNIHTRTDIDAARPLGMSTFQTSAAYKNITLKKL